MAKTIRQARRPPHIREGARPRRRRAVGDAAFRAGRQRQRRATIKLGYVSPQTGPLAAFARGRRLHHRQFQRTSTKGIGIEGAAGAFDVEVVVKDSQSESEPRRGSRQGADRRRRDRPDARRLDAGDHQPGLDPVRDRGGAVHLDGRAVAALVHRPPGQSGGGPPAVEAVQLHLPLLLGPRGRHRRLHQHVGPARDQQIGRRALPQRRRRQRLGRPGRRLPAGARARPATS